MRSPSKALMLKVGMIVFAFAVCVGATAINVRQAGPEAESSPAASRRPPRDSSRGFDALAGTLLRKARSARKLTKRGRKKR